VEGQLRSSFDPGAQGCCRSCLRVRIPPVCLSRSLRPECQENKADHDSQRHSWVHSHPIKFTTLYGFDSSLRATVTAQSIRED